jgi:hypothetical protein
VIDLFAIFLSDFFFLSFPPIVCVSCCVLLKDLSLDPLSYLHVVVDHVTTVVVLRARINHK